MQPTPEVSITRPAPLTLSPMAARILAVISTADRPLKAAAVARRLGQKNTSHLRKLLAELVRAGLLAYVVSEKESGYAMPRATGDPADETVILHHIAALASLLLCPVQITVKANGVLVRIEVEAVKRSQE